MLDLTVGSYVFVMCSIMDPPGLLHGTEDVVAVKGLL